jgi:uncharacterized protein CbrC (UPF0167 family)
MTAHTCKKCGGTYELTVPASWIDRDLELGGLCPSCVADRIAALEHNTAAKARMENEHETKSKEV